MLAKLIEKRVHAALEQRGYADLLLAGLDATVSGSTGNVLRTGAVEIASGIWSRTLAAAKVDGTSVLTPAVRHMIGRQLIRNGEIVFTLDVVNGQLSIRPASHFEVLEGYRYRCDVMHPPGRSVVRVVPAERVLHFRWATDPREPWRGIGPLSNATLLAKVAALTETKLAEDLAAPVAHIVPIPSDGGADALVQLRADIAGARGAAILTETTASGWDEGSRAGTLADWRARRLGPGDPVGASAPLRRRAGDGATGMRHPRQSRGQRRSRRNRIKRKL